MSAVASKRRREESSTGISVPSKSEIVFRSPGLIADTCLTVFEQDFHVHSVILKLYSAYFRRFLDSADKDHTTEPQFSSFRYLYTTVVDDDGVWALEPAATVLMRFLSC